MRSIPVSTKQSVEAFWRRTAIEREQLCRAVGEETVDSSGAERFEIHLGIDGVGMDYQAFVMGHTVHPRLDQVHVALITTVFER